LNTKNPSCPLRIERKEGTEEQIKRNKKSDKGKKETKKKVRRTLQDSSNERVDGDVSRFEFRNHNIDSETAHVDQSMEGLQERQDKRKQKKEKSRTKKEKERGTTQRKRRTFLDSSSSSSFSINKDKYCTPRASAKSEALELWLLTKLPKQKIAERRTS
jgi:hypothetical protein